MTKEAAFFERMKWLRKQRGFKTKEQAAFSIGVSYGTYQRWEYAGLPGRKNIRKIADFYGCSESWLNEGVGEPFPDKQTGYKEVILPERQINIEGPGEYREKPFKISEDLAMAARILESSSSYAIALHLNIRSFDEALTDKERLTRLEAQMSEIFIEINALKNENKVLKERLDDLTAPGLEEDPGSQDGGCDTEEKAM